MTETLLSVGVDTEILATITVVYSVVRMYFQWRRWLQEHENQSGGSATSTMQFALELVKSQAQTAPGILQNSSAYDAVIKRIDERIDELNEKMSMTSTLLHQDHELLSMKADKGEESLLRQHPRDKPQSVPIDQHLICFRCGRLDATCVCA
uniref:Uncharacterized protein n=1 Tax=viral metagenome TaxID=1070528 RepID=A0A2V0RKR8_9ZZZZ